MAEPVGRLLTVKDVAEKLVCGERTVYRLVELKRLAKPRKHSAREARWFQEDVDVYLYRLRRGEFEGEEDAEDTEKGTRKG